MANPYPLLPRTTVTVLTFSFLHKIYTFIIDTATLYISSWTYFESIEVAGGKSPTLSSSGGGSLSQGWGAVEYRNIVL